MNLVNKLLTTRGNNIMRHTALLAGALCASLFAASPAAAGVTYFTITGDADVTFSIDDSVAPQYFDADSFAYSTDVDLNGVSGVLNLTFYDLAFSGGIQIGPSLGVIGPQLYSGTTADPTFLLGTYALGGYTTEESYFLTISDTPPGVPEPATWAMMLLGFGAIGFSMRAQRARPKLARASV